MVIATNIVDHVISSQKFSMAIITHRIESTLTCSIILFMVWLQWPSCYDKVVNKNCHTFSLIKQCFVWYAQLFIYCWDKTQKLIVLPYAFSMSAQLPWLSPFIIAVSINLYVFFKPKLRAVYCVVTTVLHLGGAILIKSPCCFGRMCGLMTKNTFSWFYLWRGLIFN